MTASVRARVVRWSPEFTRVNSGPNVSFRPCARGALALATVPVIVREIDNPLEAERVLIESNRQRDKTTSEVMHEAEHIARIIAEENRRKMLAGVTEDGAGGRGHKLNPRPTLDEGLAPQRRTDAAVAEAVGMKRGTHRKVKAVYDAAKDESAPAPIRAVAQQQMTALDTGTTTPNVAEHVVRAGRRQDGRAGQAAQDAPGATEVLTPDNPSPEASAGFWARVRRVLGDGVGATASPADSKLRKPV